jgi:murein L,D-transpeptidase YafK
LSLRTVFARTLMASAAIAAAVALAGCQTDGTNPAALMRAMQPLSPEMVAELERRNMPKESPILVRIFKEEAELEVWKADAAGNFALLKTYPICRWSGELGPKFKEGDRQAPEGFYSITPGQMNPNSNYYLAFNLGFPNAYDRANDRTGAFLMVHGDCSSRGCYAMTDDQIGEIYALGRESFLGGQKSFQVQAYPFRMTPLNLAKHRNSPHMAFWRMIKEGSDHFEVTRQEPKVSVCEKRYVFDAVAPANSTTPLKFTPKGKCPAYEIPEDVAAAVQEKRENDEREFASYVQKGVSTVAVRTGTDGGMHPTFMAKLRPSGMFDNSGRIQAFTSTSPLPAHVTPPRAAEPETTATVAAKPVSTRVAASQPPAAESNVFSNLFGSGSDAKSESALDKMGKLLGLRKSDSDVPPPPPKPKPEAKPRPALAAAPAPARPALPPKREPPPQRVAAAPAQPAAAAAPQEPAKPTTPTAVMSGAQPVLSGGTFESRWGAFR